MIGEGKTSWAYFLVEQLYKIRNAIQKFIILFHLKIFCYLNYVTLHSDTFLCNQNYYFSTHSTVLRFEFKFITKWKIVYVYMIKDVIRVPGKIQRAGYKYTLLRSFSVYDGCGDLCLRIWGLLKKKNNSESMYYRKNSLVKLSVLLFDIN